MGFFTKPVLLQKAWFALQNLLYCRTILRVAVGAVVALAFLGKVSELGVRAFRKNANTAALPTQD